MVSRGNCSFEKKARAAQAAGASAIVIYNSLQVSDGRSHQTGEPLRPILSELHRGTKPRWWVYLYNSKPLLIAVLPAYLSQGTYFNRTAVEPKYDYECGNGQGWLCKWSAGQEALMTSLVARRRPAVVLTVALSLP